MSIFEHLSKLRLVLLIGAVVLIGASWWGIGRAMQGIEIIQFESMDIPMRYVGPADRTESAPPPGVIIAHGFSGSQQLMMGYSLTLAKAGYGTLSLDFGGHAANPAPLTQDESILQRNIDAAYVALRDLDRVDPERIGLLGHSMGSGAVMQAGIQAPNRYGSVVAVSPTSADVTAELPANLLLQAGELEVDFVENAHALLEAAGGTGGDFAAGNARRFNLIPRVEHISILFHPQSHQSALTWLNSSFEWQTRSIDVYTDRRMMWYGLHLLAWLVGISAVAPVWRPESSPRSETNRRSTLYWLALPIASIVAGFVLMGINALSEVRDIGGLLVGGALAVWFFIFGVAWLLGGFRPTAITLTDIGVGVFVAVLLTLAFGVMAHIVWMPWFMIPARLVKLPFFIVALLPWQLAAAYAQDGVRWPARWGWWLFQTAVVAAGLILLTMIVSGVGFVILLLPLIPLLLGILSVTASAFDGRPWASAIGNAIFFGWVLIVVFPLAAA